MTAVEVVALEGLPRDAWLRARRAGLGSSDAPAICNLDRFNSPFSVYLDKTGEYVDDSDNNAMKWGRILEGPVAQEFADDTGLVISKPPAMYRHADHPFMFASPDRFVHLDATEPPVALLEVKTSALRDDWKDGPPERTVIQVQHQLAVTDLGVGYVACLVNGRQYEHWRVERDDELIRLLVDIEAEFWQRVQDRNPPPVDGHRSTSDALDALYARAQVGSELELPDDARRLHDELKLAKRMKKDAEADVETLTNHFKALLGDHEIGLVDGTPVVTWKQQKPKERRHNCPDCAHPPEGEPSRTFLVK